MKRDGGEPGDASFETLGRLARAGAPGGGSGKDDRRARSRFLTRVERRRFLTVQNSLLGTLALTAALLGGWRWLHLHAQPPAPVAQVVPVKLLAPAPAVVAPAPLLAGGSVVRFTDGSELRFDPAGRGRIAESNRDGARVVLEEGGVGVHVVHHEGSAWRIEAGPFTVRVTGTTFRVGWERTSGRFDLTMTEGAVIVDGPTFSQRLVAGQVLRASTAAGIVHLGWAEVKRPRRTPALSGRAPQSAVSWSRRLALGNFRDVVDEASRAGIELVFARRSLDDLSALATAARLSGQTEIARRALAAVRARFPGTPAAAEAAFLLGRLAEDVDRNPAAAVLWYDRSYSEAPTGALAPEALARKRRALAAGIASAQ